MTNRQLFLAILAIAGLGLIYDSFFIVDERERVVLFKLGEIQGSDYPPGLHL